MDPTQQVTSAATAAAILQAFDALRPKLETLNFRTTKTVQKSRSTFFMELTIALVPLIAAGFMLTRVMKNMDPDAKRKEGEQQSRTELLAKLRAAGKPPLGRLDQYETTILSDIIFADAIDITFSDIGGYSDIKNDLYETVILPLQSPELFSTAAAVQSSSSSSKHVANTQSLLSAPKGCLFYGPPGTGKTMMAKAIAKSCSATFINVRLSTLQTKWYGESQKLVRAVFSIATKLAPTIIFIDEIDLFMRKRSGNDHEATGTMKAEFMSLWDGISNLAQVTVLAATNRPFDIDEAILRRMPRSFMFDLPDEDQREEILGVLLRGTDCAPSFDVKLLAQKTDRYSGSDLKELCRYAAMIPIREVLKSKMSLQDINSLSSAKSPTSLQQVVSSSDSRPRSVTQADFDIALKNVEPTGHSAQQYSEHFKQYHQKGNSASHDRARHNADNGNIPSGIPFTSPYNDNTDDGTVFSDFVDFIASRHTTPQPAAGAGRGRRKTNGSTLAAPDGLD